MAPRQAASQRERWSFGGKTEEGKRALDGGIKEQNNGLRMASHILPSLVFSGTSLAGSLCSSLKLQGTLEGKHVSNWGCNPGRPVLPAQTSTTNMPDRARRA